MACVDLQASVYSKSEIVADKLQDVQKLVLDPDRLPKDRPLFKVLGLTRAVFVRRELAQAITAKGFTGAGWTEVGAFRN